MGLNVLGYQSHLLQRCITILSVVTKDLPISPRCSPTIFYLIFVRCVALRNLELLIKTGWNVFVRFVAENAGRG